MTTEYYLQKRTLATWSHVTNYTTHEEAKLNFDRVKIGSGYSWRIVKVEVIETYMLSGERPIEPESPEPLADEIKSDWGSPEPGSWGKPASEATIKSEHGSVGLIWLGNPVTKEKRRVVSFEVTKMLNEGWVRAGPRTVL